MDVVMDEADSSAVEMSEMEKRALERKRRLEQLKEQAGKGNGTAGADEGGKKEGPMIFRSYQPIDDQRLGRALEKGEQMTAVEKVIEGQLQDSQEVAIKDSLDLNVLAPRKVDWDLRRGIQDKLDKLDKRTQKAVVQLIRQRLEKSDAMEGNLLAGAVNAAADAAEDDD